MFFRNPRVVAAAQSFKHTPPGMNFLKASAYGAGLGTGFGTTIGVIASPVSFSVGVYLSEKKTSLGKVSDGAKSVIKITSYAAATGAFLGGAPITFPLAFAMNAACEKHQERKSLRR